MSMSSFSALGRLTRSRRANADRYAIIRNFFHVQQAARDYSTTARSFCPRYSVVGAIHSPSVRQLHVTAATFKKSARSRNAQKTWPPRQTETDRHVNSTPYFVSNDQSSSNTTNEPNKSLHNGEDVSIAKSSPSSLPPELSSSTQATVPPVKDNTPLATPPPLEQPIEEPAQRSLPPPTPPPPASTTPLAYNQNYSSFFRQLARSLPHVHRPTKDDFLNVATGFWQRAKVRFKWVTIRSFRKFNSDDISAFVSMFLMSQTLWILVGTTTFFSVIFAIANGLGLQNLLARAASSYLTAETGVTVIFESAIVPKWKDIRISFKKVYVSRRPYHAKPEKAKDHVAAVGYDVHNHPAFHQLDDEDPVVHNAEEELNYAQFDLTIDSIDVTLSLWRWLDGRGLVEDAVVKGVRGVLDRRAITWDPENPLDPADFRHKARPGDFELDSLQLEDVLVTVYQPGEFRPFTASIFRADIRQFRKRWLFYDFLCAENVVGQFDGCLFSLHKPQSIGRTTEMDLEDGDWARMSRIRIDGVNVDHLQRATVNMGPISWITSGKIDAVLDIKFPKDPDDSIQLNAILEEIADAITTSLANPTLDRIPGQRQLAKPPLSAPQMEGPSPGRVTVDIDLRFRDIKAAVPIYTTDLSYVNNALVRPIVAFMNANRTLVPIHCRIVKDLKDFDGSWTLWDCGLLDEIAIKMYDALAYHVSHQTNMNRRVRVVSIWSLQKTATAVLSALRKAFDPVSAELKGTYLNGAQFTPMRAESML